MNPVELDFDVLDALQLEAEQALDDLPSIVAGPMIGPLVERALLLTHNPRNLPNLPFQENLLSAALAQLLSDGRATGESFRAPFGFLRTTRLLSSEGEDRWVSWLLR